jgi:hypothetical protein
MFESPNSSQGSTVLTLASLLSFWRKTKNITFKTKGMEVQSPLDIGGKTGKKLRLPSKGCRQE